VLRLVARIWWNKEPAVNTDLEAIKREVHQRFKDGKDRGETEVEIASRLVWLERQKNYALCNAMDEIFRRAAESLDLATEKSRNTANLLKWHKPLN
jgi:hypothetical protein